MTKHIFESSRGLFSLGESKGRGSKVHKYDPKGYQNIELSTPGELQRGQREEGQEAKRTKVILHHTERIELFLPEGFWAQL